MRTAGVVEDGVGVEGDARALRIRDRQPQEGKRGRGRPRVEVNPDTVERLAAILCTVEEIATVCGCSKDTLERNFAAVLKKGREAGKASLRCAQWKAASPLSAPSVGGYPATRNRTSRCKREMGRDRRRRRRTSGLGRYVAYALTDSNNNRIVEVDKHDNPVFESFTNTRPGSNPAPLPTRAVRLKNGNILISDQFNDQVIEINVSKVIVASYGTINDPGYSPGTALTRMNAPYSAYVIGDYTGITPPSGF